MPDLRNNLLELAMVLSAVKTFKRRCLRALGKHSRQRRQKMKLYLSETVANTTKISPRTRLFSARFLNMKS